MTERSSIYYLLFSREGEMTFFFSGYDRKLEEEKIRKDNPSARINALPMDRGQAGVRSIIQLLELEKEEEGDRLGARLKSVLVFALEEGEKAKSTNEIDDKEALGMLLSSLDDDEEEQMDELMENEEVSAALLLLIKGAWQLGFSLKPKQPATPKIATQ